MRSAAGRFQPSRIADIKIRTGEISDGLQRSLAVLRIAVEDPGAELFVWIVGKRADNSQRSQRVNSKG